MVDSVFEDVVFSTSAKVRAVNSSVSDATTTPGEELEVSRDDGSLVVRFLSLVDEENETLRKLVSKAVFMLRTCRYDESDIATVLAMAALQYNRFVDRMSTLSTTSEKAFIILTHVYLAHCLALDECCNISNWHKYLFASYCDLRSLTIAIIKILRKLDYQLFIDSTVVSHTSQYILS